MDPEPAKIVGHRTRRDERSPVGLGARDDRLVPRQAQRVRVRRQPAGVKQDAYWFNDGNSDDGWDAVWDVSVSADAGRLARGVPHSVLAAPLSADRGATFGLAFVRQIGRLNETSTWPLLSKNATGYVSSFGELTGLRLDRSPKRLEMVPYSSAT